MSSDRREFLNGTAWMGAVAVASGCMSAPKRAGSGEATMFGFVAPRLKRVRVGVVGLGSRGSGAVHRLAMVPGVEVTALCDIKPNEVDAQLKWLADHGYRKPRTFSGSAEVYKGLCDWDGVDVVYNCTSWESHAPIALYAMRADKHAFIEVPAAMTLDECWELVETSERTRRHCMQLENSCYSEKTMVELMLVRAGVLGELTHGDCGYIHDLTEFNHNRTNGDTWRLDWDRLHSGDQYPTHGLVPIMQLMNVNRGDRFDYLVSMGSPQACYERYEREHYPEGHPRRRPVLMPDVTTTLIKTLSGKSITVTHDVSTARPHAVFRAIMGTGGYYSTIYNQVFLYDPEHKGTRGHKPWDEKRIAELDAKYRHPLWKVVGPIAKKVGGHGGQDFIMDLRVAYCLQNGLPLDMDVYDLAASCAVLELSERSCLNGSSREVFPDFTRGGWRTAKPLGIVEIDPKRMGLTIDGVQKDRDQLSV